MEKKPVRNLKKFPGLALKSKQKDWVKKLASASGESLIRPNKQGIVYLLIDCSESMDGSNKIEQAKSGSLTFSEEAIKKGYRIGLISFGSFAQHILEPQREITTLKKQIMTLIPSGSTNLTDALQIAIIQLEESRGEKAMCIVTDGDPDNKNSALEIAKIAHAKKIDIMTIGTDDADISFLRKLSTRDELSVKVQHHQLKKGIASMAKMLPEKTDKAICMN